MSELDYFLKPHCLPYFYVSDIVTELYQRKPHATEQKVLVVLWHLLGNMTNSGSLPGAGGNIRAATAKLSKVLFTQMGQNLLNQAASQPSHIKKSLEELLDMTIWNELWVFDEIWFNEQNRLHDDKWMTNGRFFKIRFSVPALLIQ